MSTVDEIEAAILKLSAAELRELAQWFHQVEPVELTDELRSELDRRIDEADANPGAGVPWEDFRKQLGARS